MIIAVILSALQLIVWIVRIWNRFGEVSPTVFCPGYTASNVKYTENGITAHLSLAGPACDEYGDDLNDLRLTIDYETGGFSEMQKIKILTFARNPRSRQDIRR
jgi:hypothetical protein